jgi:DNA topoisomerase-1
MAKKKAAKKKATKKKAAKKKAAKGKKEGKRLVIVESPAKARTINKILGKEYTVKASMGHVKDLPRSSLGIDIEKGFEPTYRIIKGRGKTVTELKKTVSDAEAVYLAPDPDREGEAIAYHLTEALKIPKSKAFRVVFNEITKKAIQDAFHHPSRIDMNKVNAQQARRVLDRLVGYKLSPLLWNKVTRGLSAGRVQSVAVRLIVDREREIEAFRPDEYWTITGTFRPPGTEETFDAQLKEIDDKAPELKNEEAASAAAEGIRAAAFETSAVVRKEKKEQAGPPFTTSLLQQQASTRLRFSAKKTMFIAQQLYEGCEIGDQGSVGLITYMRTDSFRIAAEAVNALRDFIKQTYGNDYCPPEPRAYKTKKGAQEAHEAIRPTDVTRTPESIKQYLTPDQFKLYNLIWSRFVASQMGPVVYDTTSVEIRGNGFLFTKSGRILKFPGFHRAWPPASDQTESRIPALEQGQKLDLAEVEPVQHFTKPPPRFTEATLVKTLEKLGIGRPSTYAPIISTIQERGYVDLTSRKFHATEIGKVVTDLLVEHFPRILDSDFTSTMEASLDSIEEAQAEWVGVLEEFYSLFKVNLDKAQKNMRNLKKDPEKSDVECPKCSAPMVYRFNLSGRFLGCSRFPACKTTLSVDREGRPQSPVETEHRCALCQSPMLLRDGKRGPFLGCSAYPKCKNTLSVDSEGNPIQPQIGDQKCEKCGKPMVLKHGRRGPFLSCSGYPECKSTKPVKGNIKLPEPEKTGEDCEKCGKPMVVRSGRRGRFAACSGYPGCKFTKSLPRNQ